MKSPNTKSTDELKREVDSQLKRVEADANAIQDRLTPGQLIDDAIFYPHGRNITSTIDHLKSNPVGTAFLSLGTILLMEDNERHTMEYNARERVKSVRQNINDTRETLRGDIQDKVSGFRTRIDEVKNDLTSKVQGLKSDVTSKTQNLKSDVTSKVEDVKEGVTTKFEDIENRFGMNESQTAEDTNFSFTTEDTKQSLKDRAKDMLSTAKEKTSGYASLGKEKIQSIDPLSYMALGVGLGALTGSAFPVSEKEESLMQGKFDDKLSGLRTDLQDAINECSNILKDLVINDVKDYNVRLFRS